jgi:hypothetical protein
MATKSKSGVNPELEKMLTEMLKEAKKVDAEGKSIMSMTDRMRVIDRCLKLETIKAKMEGEGYGSGFSDD